MKRILYGLSQEPLNFYFHLKEGLEQSGIRKLEFDPFLFSNVKLICLVYLDEFLWYAQEEEDIDKVLKEFKATLDKKHTKFILDEEDYVAGFLGYILIKLMIIQVRFAKLN